jgi:protocatechuate 3,4-dioxygenase beta subunit
MRILRVALAAGLIGGNVLAEVRPIELQGRVVADSTHDPLSRARVGVIAEETDVDAVLTDDEGRFVVRIRKPSDVTLVITKAGYAARRAKLTREDVMSGRAGEHRLDVSAAISGRVVDHAGASMAGMAVIARRLEGTDVDGAPKQWSAETDDRGEFRIGGLAPGRYVVTASRAEASPNVSVAVRRGEEISGVTVALGPPKSLRADNDQGAVRDGETFRPLYGGRAGVTGHILGDEGEPLAGAVVKLLRAGAPARYAIANADGSFSITGVRAGAFRLQGTKTGYVTLEYGQSRAAATGKTLHLRDDEIVRSVRLVLPRGSAIVGTVADEHGEPIEGATVRALQLQYAAGRTRAFPVPGVRERKTDNRGQFRLFGLLPGRYIVSASVDAAVSTRGRAASQGYAPSFYPGTADLREAWNAQVDVRRDVFGAHVVLVPAPAVRVSGLALSSDGRPLKGMVLLGTSDRSRAMMLEPHMVSVAADGSFFITNVPPGDYVIQALEDPYGEKAPEFVSQLLTIADAEPDPITLTTAVGAKIEGQLLLDERLTRVPIAATLLLSPVPTNFDYTPLWGWGNTLTVDEFGWVTGSGLFGPMRFALDGAPPGWYLKSVRIASSDVTDEPFFFWSRGPGMWDARFVISTSGATISGKVNDESDQAVADYTVLVFPTDRSKWFAQSRFLKFTRPSQDDSFEVTSLPPAEYFIAAVDKLDATAGYGEWQDPALLERLTTDARRMKVSEGDTIEITLRVVRRRER